MSAKPTFFAYWSLFIAALGSFLQSYVTCIIAGALCFICSEFSLSSFQEGFAAGVILLGALLGAALSGILADKFGRRFCLRISAGLYILTSVLVYSTHSFNGLLALRFTTGLAVGITSMIIPLYLAEIALPAKRGVFVTSYQFAMTIGTLIAFWINYVYFSLGDWRKMFFLALPAACLQGVGLFFFPETPKWLLGKGRVAKAQEIETRLCGTCSSTATPLQKEKESSWQQIFSPSFRFALLLGTVLCLFQQFSGINAIIYFTPKIFGEAGFESPKQAMLSTVIVGIVNVLATFASFFLIDRKGRRQLVLISQGGVLISLCILSGAFYIHSPWTHFLSVGGVVAFLGFFSLGIGPVTWVLVSEIYPFVIRAKSIAIMTFLKLPLCLYSRLALSSPA